MIHFGPMRKDPSLEEDLGKKTMVNQAVSMAR